MSKILSSKETYTHEDADGRITTTTHECTTKIDPSGEPDYIKLYTKMWCQFNNIPETLYKLFFQLVCRMSYANATDLGHSQIVVLYGPIREEICAACGWKDDSALRKGIKELCACGAIKKLKRAVYQINPSYAGRGEWKYNPKYDRGGIEDLIATFRFKDGTVDTEILWADTGDDGVYDKTMRAGLGTKPGDGTTLKTTTYTPDGDKPRKVASLKKASSSKAAAQAAAAEEAPVPGQLSIDPATGTISEDTNTIDFNAAS